MSYTFLQEQGEESSAECFSDIPAYVLSRLNLTPEKSYYSDNGTESCQSSQSGTTSELSTEDHGEDSLTSSAGDFHAKTSAAQGKAQALTANDLDCGLINSGSFAKLCHLSHSWKTLQCSLFGGLEEFSGTWPRWGMMRNGECWDALIPRGVMATRSRIMSAIASGFLRYPTPRANDALKRGDFDAMNPRNGLAGFVRRYPTPMASDNRDRGNMKNPSVQRRLEIGKQIGLGQILGGQPNPEFVEWLMGWPMGWTDLKPLETARFQQWLHSHGRF